jgi:co-chaperonin GroES (HSP10)
MTSPLILPESVVKAAQKASNPLEQAYVKAEERVLDPSKIPQSYLDRLPKPTGWRILILPYRGKARSDGGVYIPDEVREKTAMSTVAGYVLKMGSDCYTDKNRYPNGPWCAQGDWIVFGRYAGARFKFDDGSEVRIINEDEVIATIADPDDIHTV